ncbi:hypothetical protein [Brevibacillus agri]|uniref:hypothetical protein n=1 Tax=Brevibacillus agri TaxID=51101 RepID=UPI002867E856|nr:hypothetical protein [Brevibacillus agri]
MALPMSKINDLLCRWAANDLPVINFTVNNVLKEIGLDYSFYDEVFSFLMRKDGYELIAKKMLLCPKKHPGKTFLLKEEVDEEEIFHCWCDEDYYYDPEQTIVVFCFSESFIKEEQLKKKSRSRCIHI